MFERLVERRANEALADKAQFRALTAALSSEFVVRTKAEWPESGRTDPGAQAPPVLPVPKMLDGWLHGIASASLIGTAKLNDIDPQAWPSATAIE